MYYQINILIYDEFNIVEDLQRDMPINFEVAEQKGIAIIKVAEW